MDAVFQSQTLISEVLQSKTQVHLATCARGHGTQQKWLPGWACRSCAKLLSAASHFYASLMQMVSSWPLQAFSLQLNMSNRQGESCESAVLCQPFRDTRRTQTEAAAAPCLCCPHCCFVCLTCPVFINLKKWLHQSHAVFFPGSVLFVLKLLPLQLGDFSKSLKRAVGFNGMHINHR